MKNKQNKKLLLVCLTAVAAMVILSITAGGGNLEPASPPAPTMHSLDEIYNMASSVGMPVWPLGVARTRSIAYVNINNGGVQGESTDPAHPNWIEALSASWQISQPVSAGTASSSGGKSTGSKVTFSEIYFVKEIDKASPQLAVYCANGKAIQTAMIEFTQIIAGSRKTYLKLTLNDAMVVSVMPVMSPRGKDDYTHLEQISLRYGKVEWRYTRYDSNGNPVETVKTNWDASKNKGG